MKFVAECDSNVGAVREVNQDAVGIRHIGNGENETVFMVLCDGMGGYAEGEIASSYVLKKFLEWFDERFIPNINQWTEKTIRRAFEELVEITNKKIYTYGRKKGIILGTTITAFLAYRDGYYILNIGDCRAYEIGEKIFQVTEDHSVVAREVKLGRLTKEQARTDSRRNQILKCIGAKRNVDGDFYTGRINKQNVYMLCCDGVRNCMMDEELQYYFHPQCMTSREAMINNIRYVFQLNMQRGENDNMSVAMLRGNETTVKISNKNEIEDIYKKEIINSHNYLEVEND